MRRVAFLGFHALVLAVSVLSLTGVAYPCSAVRASARVDLFTCPCPDPNGPGNIENPIHVVTGTVIFTNRRSAPTLGNLVVELQAKKNGKYVVVGRQVLDEAGHTVVNTCQGSFAAGPLPGRIALTDGSGTELSFADVKNLPLGVDTINYVATFAGFIPEITPGSRIRVKTYTTVIGADSTKTCSADADGNGSVDAKVRTISVQKVVKVPTVAAVITPPNP